MQKEIWKQVKGFPKYYVSSEGRVYSTNRNIFLKQFLCGSKNRYYAVQLSNNGVSKRKSVHRLVLETFNPVEGMRDLTVNHIDENCFNNRLENLEWMTLDDNIRYSSGQWVQQETIEGEPVAKFASIRAAARAIGTDIHTMLRHVNSGTPCKNFIWKRIDNPRKK